MDKWSRLFAAIEELATEDLSAVDSRKEAETILELFEAMEALRALVRRNEQELVRRGETELLRCVTRGQDRSAP